MKQSYYFGDEITTNSVQDFLMFMNKCNDSPVGPPSIIDLYLDSPGGSMNGYSALKEAIESSEIPIHIKGVGMLASCAFMLFYFTESCIKSLSHSAYGLIHLATMAHDDREARKPHSYTQVMKEHIDMMNEEYFQMYKKHKVITSTQLKEILKGEDVTIHYLDLYKTMLKCPFGTFLKEGETVILEK